MKNIIGRKRKVFPKSSIYLFHYVFFRYDIFRNGCAKNGLSFFQNRQNLSSLEKTQVNCFEKTVMLPKMVGEIARKLSKTGLAQRRQKAYLCSAS